MARQIARAPGEERILALIFLVAGLGFVSGLPAALASAPRLGAEATPAGVITGRFIASFFFTPLMIYAAAALVTLVARVAGGSLNWRHGRLALVWALVLALPVLLLGGLAEAAAAVGLVPAVVARGLGLLGFVAFLWIWAACLAEAAGFARTLPVFVAMALALAAPVFLLAGLAAP